MQSSKIRIGTRGSPLALAQAHETRDRLIRAHGLSPDDMEIVIIRTTGDKVQDRPLAEIGGKGLFTREIEEALLARRIDLAVHSMKDMPTELPRGLVIPTMLEREDVRDAFICRKAARLDDLPEGAVIGSSSLRRQAQLRHRRPDLQVVMFRGNVQTRLKKLDEGQVDATFLACAGLRRLDMAHIITEAMATTEMLPAVAQGAIGIEVREDNAAIRTLLDAIHHPDTFTRVSAERTFLHVLDGSCRTPIAALAELDGGTMNLRAMILTPDGRICHETTRRGPATTAVEMGRDAGAELKALGGPDFFAY